MASSSPQNGRTDATPKLSYKYQRLRERLREAIESGELSGHLPGERELARRYGANAKTLNKALNDLATEGLLVRHVGRGTCVAKDLHEDPVLGRTRAFCWLVAEGKTAPFDELACSRAVEIARQGGHELTRIEATLDESGQLPARALSPGQLRGLDGLIIYATPAAQLFLADLIRRHIPFVQINGLSEDASTNTVNPDYTRGAFELTEYLVGLGHTDVRIVGGPGLSPLIRLAIQGHEIAMRRHRLTPPPPLILQSDDRLATRDALHDVFHAGKGATAAVCIGPFVMRASRETAGGQLSIAAVLDPSHSLNCEQLLTTYDVDLHRMVKWAMQILMQAAPAQKPQQIIVPGRLVTRGASTAPRPGRHVLAAPREAVL